MAKTIKFNLICDGYPARTLEDLREHFSIEDILAHHESGMLQRWLEVRGFENELEAVRKIPTTNQMTAAKELVKLFGLLFGVETDEAKVEEVVYMLQYEQERKENTKKYHEEHQSVMTAFSQYLRRYQELKDRIASHSGDYAALKADIAELHTEYMPAFELDYRNLFYYLKDTAPMAVYWMLAYDDIRKKYIPEGTAESADPYMNSAIDEAALGLQVDILLRRTNTDLSNRDNFIKAVRNKESRESLARKLVKNHNIPVLKPGMAGFMTLDYQNAVEEIARFLEALFPQNESIVSQDAQKMYDELCSMTTNKKLKIYFSDTTWFHEVKRNTNGNWDDIVQTGNKCMVLWFPEGCDVRSNGFGNQQYSAKEAKNRFLLLDGIDFRSQKELELLYLEV